MNLARNTVFVILLLIVIRYRHFLLNLIKSPSARGELIDVVAQQTKYIQKVADRTLNLFKLSSEQNFFQQQKTVTDLGTKNDHLNAKIDVIKDEKHQTEIDKTKLEMTLNTCVQVYNHEYERAIGLEGQMTEMQKKLIKFLSNTSNEEAIKNLKDTSGSLSLATKLGPKQIFKVESPSSSVKKDKGLFGFMRLGKKESETKKNEEGAKIREEMTLIEKIIQIHMGVGAARGF